MLVTERMNLFTTVHAGYRFRPMHIARLGACAMAEALLPPAAE